MRNLRNVNKSVDSLFNLNERAETYNSYDFTFYGFADRILIGGKLPGLRLKLFISERNLLGFLIAFQHFEFILLTDFKNVGRSFSVGPTKVGNMSKAIESVYVYKRAERSESYYRTGNDVAFVDRGEEFLFLFSLSRISFRFFGFENNSLGSDDLLSSALIFNFFGFKS